MGVDASADAKNPAGLICRVRLGINDVVLGKCCIGSGLLRIGGVILFRNSAKKDSKADVAPQGMSAFPLAQTGFSQIAGLGPQKQMTRSCYKSCSGSPWEGDMMMY